MTTLRVDTVILLAFRDQVSAAIRPPDVVTAYAADDPTLGEVTWNTDLTPAELAIAEEIRGALTNRLPSAQYTIIRTEMQALRDLRQLGRNAFMALTAAERDRLTYDALVSITRVLLAMQREE